MVNNDFEMSKVFGFNGNKNLRVDGDTQVHMSSRFTRRNGDKEKVKRNFSFVVKGFMIASVLVGSFLGGISQAFASTPEGYTTANLDNAVGITSNQEVKVRDEQAILSNLRMANKLLTASFERGEISDTIYQTLLNRLNSLSSYLDEAEIQNQDLMSDILAETDHLLSIELASDAPTAIVAKRAESIQALKEIRQKLGIEFQEVSGADAEAIQQGGSVTSPSVQSLTVYATKATVQSRYPTAKVVVNGKTMNLDQPAIVKNGATLIPVRGVFEELGATISYNSAKQQVTAIKGTTKVIVNIGSKVAYINGAKATLTQPAEVVNGRTLVPLRFISEALGAKVSWNQQTNTATVTLAKPSTTKPVEQSQTQNGIKALYGSHTYGVKTQAEYDKVMEIIKPVVDSYKDNPWYKKHSMYNDEFQQGVDDYLNNGTVMPWDGVGGVRYAGNKEIQKIESLTSRGVSKQEAIELVTLQREISSLLKGDINKKLSNSSAYDGLVKGIIDCGSFSYTASLVYDAVGYSTAIVANSTHANPYVKINGDWYMVAVGFKYVGKNLPSGGDQYILSAPTY